jgi:hypothetical protein
MTPELLKDTQLHTIGERVSDTVGRVISRCFFSIFGLPE